MWLAGSCWLLRSSTEKGQGHTAGIWVPLLPAWVFPREERAEQPASSPSTVWLCEAAQRLACKCPGRVVRGELLLFLLLPEHQLGLQQTGPGHGARQKRKCGGAQASCLLNARFSLNSQKRWCKTVHNQLFLLYYLLFISSPGD